MIRKLVTMTAPMNIWNTAVKHPQGRKSGDQKRAASDTGKAVRITVHGSPLRRKSSQNNSAWQFAPQGSSQNKQRMAVCSAGKQPEQQRMAVRSAGDSQSSSAWQSAPQGSAASWSAQGSAQDSRQADAQAQEQHHTTGGWAPRRPEFHHASHQRPEHTKRSGRSLAGKIAGVTAAAVLFGTVAGGTMFAVDTAGEYLKGQYTTIGQTETQAQVKVA